MKRNQPEQVDIVEEEALEEPEQHSHWLRLVVGVLFIGLAMALLVAILAGGRIPALAATRGYLHLFLGRCILLLPAFALIIGAGVLSDEQYSFFSWKNLFLFLLFLSIPALVGYFDPRSQNELITTYLKRGAGGGAVGSLVNFLLEKFLRRDITIWVISGTFLLSLLFVLPYRDIFHALIWPFVKMKKLFSHSEGEEEVEPEGENDEIIQEEIPSPKAAPKRILGVPIELPVEPEVKSTRSDGGDELSIRSIIAQRRKKGGFSDTEKKPEQPPTVSRIYNRDEFKGFSDEVRDENPIKHIMSRRSGSNVYNKPGVRKAIKDSPISIPSWQREEDCEETEEYYDEAAEVPEDPGEPIETWEVEEPAAPAESKVIELYPDKKITSEPEVIPQSVQEPAVPLSIQQTTVRKTGYRYPKVDLLDQPRHLQAAAYEKDIQKQCAILQQTLADFNVKATLVGVTRGPSVTRFELEPAPGVKVSSITSLADDIALKLAASGVRIESPIPGKAAIGIEVPNVQNDAVFFREVVDSPEVRKAQSPLCIGLGKDISGNVITINLTKMPHLLVAGSTGSGKSVCINTLISGILFKAHPEEVKLILVDPKMVELSAYNGIPHLLTPVVTDMKKAASALRWARKEMERRYQLFAEGHAREINTYNLGARQKLPYIVIIIDELSDLMMAARIDVEDAILALAQKARAAGIHLVLATQRPSVDVITGVIKANIPSRISFAVSSQTDSRTILDMGGAEKLIGKGDMLYYPIGVNKPLRVQGAFISDGEIDRITKFVVDQHFVQNFVEEVTTQTVSETKDGKGGAEEDRGDDEIFPEVVRLVLDTGQASASMLQRRFRVGYTRAARLVDTLEKLGVVGPASGSKPRAVIMSREEIENKFFSE